MGVLEKKWMASIFDHAKDFLTYSFSKYTQMYSLFFSSTQ